MSPEGRGALGAYVGGVVFAIISDHQRLAYQLPGLLVLLLLPPLYWFGLSWRERSWRLLQSLLSVALGAGLAIAASTAGWYFAPLAFALVGGGASCGYAVGWHAKQTQHEKEQRAAARAKVLVPSKGTGPDERG